MSSSVRASQRITQSPADEIGVGRVAGLALEHRLVEAGRQRVDQVDVAGELAVLLARDAAGDEDAEMADRSRGSCRRWSVRRSGSRRRSRRDRESSPSACCGGVTLSPFEQNTTIGERMLRRSIAVPSRRLDPPGGELVADEQLVDDELDFLGVQIDVAAPPALEAEIARRLGVDLGIEIVLLGPERVGRVLVLEILHQPGAVELAVTEIAGQARSASCRPAGRRCSASDSCRARRPSRTAASRR